MTKRKFAALAGAASIAYLTGAISIFASSCTMEPARISTPTCSIDVDTVLVRVRVCERTVTP